MILLRSELQKKVHIKLWGDIHLLVDPETYSQLQAFRKERIETGFHHNNGKEIIDPYAQARIMLDTNENPNVTGIELRIVSSAHETRDLIKSLGEDFFMFDNPLNKKVFYS